MENSIQSFVLANPADKISEVERIINHNDIGEKTVLLVEGDDDETFYSKYLDTDHVYIYGMNGCEHFVKILDELDHRYPGKLAVIKDADFDHLNSITYSHTNLFLTDQHDYEMMIVSPDRVIAIATDYGLSADEASGIYDAIMDNISNYSFIKWHNSKREEDEKGINFRSSKAIHHYGKTIEDSLEILRPTQHPEVTLDPVGINILIESNPDVDKRQLINGHDFCELIPKAIKDIRVTNIKNRDIPTKLIALYSTDDFSSTSLARALDSTFPGMVLR